MRLGLLVGFLLGCGNIYCCTCVQTGKFDLANEIKGTDVILIGKVIDSTLFTVNSDDSLLPQRMQVTLVKYRIAELETYKGRISNDTIEVVTGLGTGGDCGYNFEIGARYIVFANYRVPYNTFGKKVRPFLSTDTCMHNEIETPKAVTQLEKYLKKRPHKKK